jgi:hypothetical protein
MTGASLLVLMFGYVVCGFLALLGLAIIYAIWTGRIDISGLISEANGSASLARFQFLLISFAVTASLYGLVEMRLNGGGYPDVPRGVLILFGMSAATFLLSKGISFSQPDVMMSSSPGSTSDFDDDRQPAHSSQVRRQGLPQRTDPLVLVVVLVGLLGVAAHRGELSASLATLLAVLGGLTVWFIGLFLRAVDADGPPHVETHWGGLGGGIGGWSLSSSLIYLICAGVVGTVSFVVFLNHVILQKN